MMKPNKNDYLDSLDADREWIHTEVLGQGRKRSRFISNLTVVLVLIIAVCLIYISFKEMFGKQDQSNLENMNQITKEQQAANDLEKAKEDAAAQAAADAAAKAQAVQDNTMVYSVKSGDTLTIIADQFKVDLKTIADANGLQEPYALEVGQQLKIPGVQKPADTTTAPASGTAATAPAAGGQNYTVKAGDTLADIGLQFGISYQDIAKLNNLQPPYDLEVGQVLQIPKKQ